MERVSETCLGSLEVGVGVYDPYHQSEDGGWHACCEANMRLGESTSAYANLRGRQKYGARALSFEYRRWRWFNEVYFEDLPRPSRLSRRACGVCAMCVRVRRADNIEAFEELREQGIEPSSGRVWCLFPQELGTYARWHRERSSAWLF